MDNLSYSIKIIYNLCGTLTGISMISGVTLFPLVFNRIIVPEIERKIGQKLGYYMIYYEMKPFSKYLFRSAEVSFYIVAKCLIKRYGKDPNIVKVGPRSYALQRVNYSYEMFSKKEIRWSFAVIISYLLFFICGGLLMLLVNHYGIH